MSEDANSMFLTNASVYFNGSALIVMCMFAHIDNVSCVLVGREYKSKTLLVEVNGAKSPLPVPPNGNYTFSIFGKNDTHIDERPLVTEQIVILETTTSQPDVNETENIPGILLTLGAHAQRGLQYMLCVCLFACVSVSSYSPTTGSEADGERYQWLQYYKC